MTLIRRYLPFLLLCLAMAARAQRPLLRHYTVRDGLPSDVIYDIYQDSRGFIWCSTDQGISRFDGREFRNLSVRDGLPDNEIFSVGEDDYRRLWIACYNHRACYLRNGKVYNSSNDALCREIERAGLDYYALYRDSRGRACLFGQRIGILNAEHLTLRDVGTAPDERICGNFTRQGQEYIVSTKRIIRLAQGKAECLLSGEIKTAICIGELIVLFRFDRHIPVLEVWRFSGGRLQPERRIPVPYWVYYLKEEPDGSMRCCTDAGHLLYRPPAALPVLMDKLPAGTSNNRWLRDREGNEWFTTINNGVYMQLRAAPRIIDDRSGLSTNNILCLQATPYGTLLAGNDLGVLTLVRDSQVHNFQPIRPGYINRVRFVCAVGEHTLLAGSDWGVHLVNMNTGAHRAVFTDAAKAGAVRNGHCLIACAGRAMRYDMATGRLSLYWQRRTTAIEEDAEGHVWLGTLDGLYRCRDGDISRYEADTVLLHKRITSLLVLPQGILAIGTSTGGLFLRTKDTVLHLDERNGLSGNSCKRMAADAAGRLWLCTDNGLDRIDLRSFPSCKIYTYALSDGLPGARLNDVAVAGNKLYVASSAGITVLDNRPDSPLPADTPRLYITSIDGAEMAQTAGQQALVRSYDSNSLQIAYTGVSFASGDDVRYRYLLEGGGPDTVSTGSRTINFSALSPGDYRLLIWAGSRNGPWTAVPASLRFRILPPWWLNRWLIVAFALFLLIMTILLYRRRIRQVQRKAERTAAIRRQMAELEMKALRAQINPHFIFNALNSIQTYYSSNDELKANHYMTAFAQFIRKTLTHSQSHWIPLSEELGMLQTYIELEQMRFKQVFSYRISVAEDIHPGQTEVPAMLIQPYVENAINHGLRHLRGRPGELLLRFTLHDQSLVCLIDDNGIGVQAAQRNRSVNHQSFGMHINRQRIETINQLYRTSIRMTVTDKHAADPSQHGTAIEITIPLKMTNAHAEHPADR